MRILTRTTGYCIVKSSDNEDTDVRWLDIIPQSTLQGRGILQGQEDKGCASNNGVGQLRSCKTKMKWDDDVLYVNGLTCDNSASSILKRNDKALYNNQLDKALHTFATTATAIITSVGNIGLTPSSFRCQQ